MGEYVQVGFLETNVLPDLKILIANLLLGTLRAGRSLQQVEASAYVM